MGSKLGLEGRKTTPACCWGHLTLQLGAPEPLELGEGDEDSTLVWWDTS